MIIVVMVALVMMSRLLVETFQRVQILAEVVSASGR